MGEDHRQLSAQRSMFGVRRGKSDALDTQPRINEESERPWTTDRRI